LAIVSTDNLGAVRALHNNARPINTLISYKHKTVFAKVYNPS